MSDDAGAHTDQLRTRHESRPDRHGELGSRVKGPRRRRGLRARRTVRGDGQSLSALIGLPDTSGRMRAVLLLEAPANACATKNEATRARQTKLWVQCPWCGHGVGSVACAADAPGARGESVNSASAAIVCLTVYGSTRVNPFTAETSW